MLLLCVEAIHFFYPYADYSNDEMNHYAQVSLIDPCTHCTRRPPDEQILALIEDNVTTVYATKVVWLGEQAQHIIQNSCFIYITVFVGRIA